MRLWFLWVALLLLPSCRDQSSLTVQDREWRDLEAGAGLENIQAAFKLIRAFESPESPETLIEWGWRVTEEAEEAEEAEEFDFSRFGPCPRWAIVLLDADGFKVTETTGMGWPPQQSAGHYLSLQNARRVAKGTIERQMREPSCP